MCTDENDIEELTGMYGPLCWQGYDKDPGGFQKLIWYGSMKELNCKATYTWSVCGRARENACTHRHLIPEKNEETSQLDYIIGPMTRNDEVYIHNDVRTLATWDHYTNYARIQNEEQTKNTCEGKEKEEVDWMETKDRRANNGILEKGDVKER